MAETEGGGSGRNDVIFIVYVLLFLIAVWFFTGGPKRSVSGGSLFLTPSGIFSPTSTAGVPTVNFGSGGFDANGNNSDNYNNQSNTGLSPDLTEAQKNALGLNGLPTSPYAGKIHLLSGAGNYAVAVNDEYITLQADQNNRQQVSITGWKLQSAINKRTAVIYQGEEVYTPSASPNPGPIVLKAGDTVTISSGRSPIGTSFRENKCTGYLSQFQTFTPNLQEECPAPIDEISPYNNSDQSNTQNDCLDYVRTLSSCRTDVNPPSSLSDSCRSLIQNRLTYSGCVSAHQQDSDFKQASWRIYLGYTEKIWQNNREVLTLLDSEGKLVDSIVF